MFIIFLGPDGAGKSTVITALKKTAKKNGIDCHDFYLVPGFFSRYRNSKNGVVQNDPHSKVSRGKISSVFKLFFWILEYNLGAYFKLNSLLKSGSWVIFDRFYYDIYVDPKRYCYGGGVKFAKFIGRFIPRPDRIFILTASPFVIQSRKKEVPFIETVRQIDEYELLSKNLKNSVIINTERSMDMIIREIMSNIKQEHL